jgi:hypothetical protein
MTMPRTVDEILAQADELARRFEDDALGMPETVDAGLLREVRHAFKDVARSTEQLGDAISLARASGHSWAAIGLMIGTTGEAARQRYGKLSSLPTT